MSIISIHQHSNFIVVELCSAFLQTTTGLLVRRAPPLCIVLRRSGSQTLARGRGCSMFARSAMSSLPSLSTVRYYFSLILSSEHRPAHFPSSCAFLQCCRTWDAEPIHTHHTNQQQSVLPDHEQSPMVSAVPWEHQRFASPLTSPSRRCPRGGWPCGSIQ